MDTTILYIAMQDEIWRLNVIIHKTFAKPTIYREGKTYIIASAFLESDVLWFRCYELIVYNPYLHMRIPFISDVVIYCASPAEWNHLLLETGVVRHVYFEQSTRMTQKLVSRPLTE